MRDCFSLRMGWILTLSAVKAQKTEWTADRGGDQRVSWFSGLLAQLTMLQIENDYLWHLLHAFVIDCLLAAWTSCKNRQQFTLHTPSDI